MKRMAWIFVGACALMLAWPATDVARAAAPYVGVGGGAGVITIDKETVQFHTQDWKPGASLWRVFAGYDAGHHVGIEAGYLTFGKPRVSTQDTGDFFETKLSGFDVTPTGALPIVKNLSAFARAGAVFWKSEWSWSYTAMSAGTTTKSGTGLALGLGAEYAITPHVLVRIEGAYYGIDKAKAGAGGIAGGGLSARYAF